MELFNTFVVPAPIGEAWSTLLDVECVAPCMPGAALETFDGDAFTGGVRVKIGAIQMTYNGQGTFVERNEAEHRVVIEASGKERRGGGTAAATINCVLTAVGESTQVDVKTELAITGKPAQFGRGAIADISGKIVDQFAAALAAQLTQPLVVAANSESNAPTDASERERSAPSEAIDLVQLAGPALVSRLRLVGICVIAAATALFLARRLSTRPR